MLDLFAMLVAQVFRNEASCPPRLMGSRRRASRRVVAALVAHELEAAGDAQQHGENEVASLPRGPSSSMTPTLLEPAEGPLHEAEQHPAGLQAELQGEGQESESGKPRGVTLILVEGGGKRGGPADAIGDGPRQRPRAPAMLEGKGEEGGFGGGLAYALEDGPRQRRQGPAAQGNQEEGEGVGESRGTGT